MKTLLLALTLLVPCVVSMPAAESVPPAVQQWEYIFLTLSIKRAEPYDVRIAGRRFQAASQKALVPQLRAANLLVSNEEELWAALGEDGWEFVAVHTDESTAFTTYYFKRPKPAAGTRRD